MVFDNPNKSFHFSFHPDVGQFLFLIILNIQNKDLPLSAKQQAILISNSELKDNIKSIIFHQTEGWILDFNDYKTSFLMAFNFKVNDKFSISLQYDIAYDSEPILNAVEDDQGLSTKFSYSFN